MSIYDYHGDVIMADTKHVEPEKIDIPRLYLSGGMLPQTKSEGKVRFKVQYISESLEFSEYCTLKVQGDSSASFPKKNYNIQFFGDSDYKKKSKHNFKGWGEQSKYTLKANWSDITHARNVVTARLWSDMVRQRSNYDSLPEALLSSPNLGVIDGFSVKVYHNGIYQGRYTFNIPKDAWAFNMDDKLETNVVLYGEGRTDLASLFKAEARIDGIDWTDEIHEDGVPESVLNRFNAFIRFVMNSTDSDFVNGLSDYVDVESLIDVQLMAFVDCGIDSIGKNEIFMSYDGQKYICSVYDLDSTWGARFNGEFIYNADYSINSDAFTQSLLHQRVRGLLSAQMKTRYAELRQGALSASNIVSRFSEFMENLPRTLIEQDFAETTADGAFIGMPEQETNTIERQREYIINRLKYLDTAMEEYYPKIVASFNSGNDPIYTDYDLNSLKPYLTVKYYENNTSSGVVIDPSNCELLGKLTAGTASICVRYNGYSTRVNVTALDYYDQRQWSYPSSNANVQTGYVTRKTIWNAAQMTILNVNTGRVAICGRGVYPYIDNSSTELMTVYPIPLPKDVNKITINVTPSTLKIKPSIWQWMPGVKRYARTEDAGVLGSGSIVWSNFNHVEGYDEYLCVEFKTPSEGSYSSEYEVREFNIIYETTES